MSKSKDKTISKLKYLEDTYKSYNNRRNLIIKDIEDLKDNINYSRALVEDLYSLKLPLMTETEVRDLVDLLIKLHFPELKGQWVDSLPDGLIPFEPI